MSARPRRRWARSRRALFPLVTAIVLTIALPNSVTAPAEAHTRTTETTNIVSVITTDPLPAGITFTVYTGGLVVGLTNTTGHDVTVLGYEGEPYVRIGPTGVFENSRSPAAWLNRARFADVAIPPSVDASAPPAWRQVSSTPTWTWHDHRTHWMSPTAPTFVDAPTTLHTLMRMELVGPVGLAHEQAGPFQSWSVPLLVDEAPLTVRGELRWIDPPPARGWLAAALALLIIAYLAPPRRNDGGLTRMATIVVAVAALNGIHLVDDLVAFPGDLLDELFGVLHTTLFLATGIVGALWARLATSGRRLALGIGAGAVLYHQGLVHLPMLYASQFPTVWPDSLVRLTVALGLLQALFAALTLWRTRPKSVESSDQSSRSSRANSLNRLGFARSPSPATSVRTSRGSR